MKTNSFAKKWPVWACISGAILVIGLVLFLIFGFNYAVSEGNSKSITVQYDSYVTLEDSLLDTTKDTCLDAIKNNSLTVKQVKHTSYTNGGNFEFVFDESADVEKLETVKDAVLSALSNKAEISDGYFTAAVNSYNRVSYATYLGRFAIAGACALVVVFAYAAIRFRLGGGITVALLAVHDVLMVLALTAIVRIPVSLAFVGAAGFSFAVSVLFSAISFSSLRKVRKDENLKAMPADEAFELVSAQARKTVVLVASLVLCALVVSALISLIASVSMLTFVVPALIAVAVSAYSSICLLPAVYMPMKAVADKKAAKKAVKYVAAEKKVVIDEPAAEEPVAEETATEETLPEEENNND